MGSRQNRRVLFLAVEGVGDRFVDLSRTATIGDLISCIRRDLTAAQLPEFAIAVDRTATTLEAGDHLAAGDLRSGDSVRVVHGGSGDDPTGAGSASGHDAGSSKGDYPANLTMFSGPKAGETFGLRDGSNALGRVATNDVVLVDPGISRHHGSIVVDGTGLIVTDNGSTNGIMVDGVLITEPTAVRPGQQILLGHSRAVINLQTEVAPVEPDLGQTFEPVKRQNIPYEGNDILLPRPPDPEARARRREFLLSGRNEHRQALEHFERTVESLTEQLDTERDYQRNVRLSESPSLDELITALPQRSLLWSRLATDTNALVARVGIGTVKSRTRFRPPGGGRQDLRTRLASLAEQYSVLTGAPATVDFRKYGTIGIHGPMEQVRGLAYSLVGQLALNVGPDHLGVITRPGVRGPAWDWLKWLPHGHLSGSAVGVTDNDFEAVVTALLDSDMLPSGLARPPVVLIVIDDDRPLPVEVLTRLLQQGPGLGIHALLLSGETNGFNHPLGAMINVGQQVADIQRDGQLEAEAIALETANPLELVAAVRQIAPLRYPVDAEAPLTAEACEESDADGGSDDEADVPPVALGPFQLGGQRPPGILPTWWRESPAVTNARPLAASAPSPALPPAPAAEGLAPPAPSAAPPAPVPLPVPLPAPAPAPAPVMQTPPPPAPVTAEVPMTPAELEAPPIATQRADDRTEAEAEVKVESEVEPELAAEVETEDEVEAPVEGDSIGAEITDELDLDADESEEEEEDQHLDSDPASGEQAEDSAEVDADDSPAEDHAAEDDAVEEEPAEEVASADEHPPEDEDLVEDDASEAPQAEASGVADASVDDADMANDEGDDESEEDVPVAPAMPERPLDIASLPHAGEDSRLILGTVSVPGMANPALFALNLAQDGVLVLSGPSGAGKTTALRSVAVAAGLIQVPAEKRPAVTYLDGQGGLALLDSLPNVTGVGLHDPTRAAELLSDLERLIADRLRVLEELGADPASLEEQRRLNPESPFRRVVVLIDDVKAVASMLELESPGRFGPVLEQLITDGGRLGVHLVFAANGRSEVDESVASKVGRWLILGGDPKEASIAPGRAAVGKSEVRFATAASL